ncbi:BMP family ABC transporter substrate-binding protein [Lachnospiraceae bacterium ZAX-1]
MKKKLAMLCVVCLAVGTVMFGCAKPEQEEKGNNDTIQGDELIQGEEFEGETKDYKVAMMIPGTLGDKSFFDAAFESVDLLKKELGIEVDYVEAGGDSSKYYPAYVDLCEKGYDLILTVSSNGEDALVQVAEEFPEQKFINLDGQLEDIPSNVYIIAPRNNEMSYIAGVVAARKAKELGDTKVGFIGGMDIPGINEFLVGYIEGVQSIEADMKVAASYVGSFTDTAKGKENALLLYDSGVSIIFTAAGQSGLGVIDAAVQKSKLVIGVDSDQAEALKDSQPEMASVIITSAIKNIPGSALYIVKKAMKGEVTYGTKELFGVKEEAVGIAENEFYEKLLSEQDRSAVEEIKTKIINGDLKVTDTSVLTPEELEEIRTNARP